MSGLIYQAVLGVLYVVATDLTYHIVLWLLGTM